jgi:hypothetical protein
MLITGLFVLAGASVGSTQTSPPADEIVVGPVPLTQNVQGVAVTLQIQSRFKLSTKADGLYLNATVQADLSDLQRKFGAIVDTIPLPKDNCKSFTLLNPVVSLDSRSLRAEEDAAVITLSGDVVGWTCLENPIPETYWDSTGCRGKWPWGGEYVFGCLKTRPGSPIKNKNVTQPFDASLPVYLRKTGTNSLSLVTGDPNVRLGGQFVGVTNKILQIAGININDEAKKALDKAIDPNRLAFSIPKEYADLNPQIIDAKLESQNGILAATVSLSAVLPAEKLNEFLKGLVEGLKKS